MKLRAIIFMPGTIANKIFSVTEMNRLLTIVDIPDNPPKKADINSINLIKGAEIIITGWETSCSFTKDVLDLAPQLKLIAHTAGSIKFFVTDEIWNRNIVVTSAAASLGIGVAEYTLGLMLNTLKRISEFNEITHKGGWIPDEELAKIKEVYGITVGVVGAGYVGRNFIRLLKNFEVNILLYDPFCSEKEALALGVQKVELDELIKTSDVISLHVPSLESTNKMINREKLKLMKNGAILINTARGSLIDEIALCEEAKTGRITVCLDVTDPEPPGIDSPLRTLPNVILTPHIAGAVTNNRFRQGKYIVDEIERFIKGEKLKYQVTKDMLEKIA